MREPVTVVNDADARPYRGQRVLRGLPLRWQVVYGIVVLVVVFGLQLAITRWLLPNSVDWLAPLLWAPLLVVALVAGPLVVERLIDRGRVRGNDARTSR
jgi:hypothetical protein